MEKILNTIKNLKTIAQDRNCSHMNLSTIKGYIGELIVKSKLELEGCKVEQKGNQSGYDLEFDDIKIDVKTSTLKEETPGELGWGWALKQKSKKRKITCTHFVCVALDKNYNEEMFYIIKKEDTKYFLVNQKRFKNVTNKFGIFVGEKLKNKKVYKINPQASLKRALEKIK